MMKNCIKRLLFSVLLVMAALMAVEAAPIWEKINTRQPETVETTETANFNVRVYDGAIILSIPSKTIVKVITILGQPVAQQELDAGTWRLPIPVRGIYILKIGSVTRRITI